MESVLFYIFCLPHEFKTLVLVLVASIVSIVVG